MGSADSRIVDTSREEVNWLRSAGGPRCANGEPSIDSGARSLLLLVGHMGRNDEVRQLSRCLP